MKNSVLFLLFIGLSMQVFSQQRILIFANGYLGPKFDSITTKNQITTQPASYWYFYDDSIVKRFQPTLPVYIDGHHPLSTSSHRNKFKFGISYLFAHCIPFRSRRGFGLNHKPNPEGFQLRYDNGQICGKNYLDWHQKTFGDIKGKDTMDIVCHSMGYAYILGFLSAVDETVVLGKILVISAECGSCGGYDWNRFEEVWQYGSNLGEKKADVIFNQDGIAPQEPLKNIEHLASNKGGRVFVPKNAQRGFLKSHHLDYFNWFFTIKENDRGYFKR